MFSYCSDKRYLTYDKSMLSIFGSKLMSEFGRMMAKMGEDSSELMWLIGMNPESTQLPGDVLWHWVLVPDLESGGAVA